MIKMLAPRYRTSTTQSLAVDGATCNDRLFGKACETWYSKVKHVELFAYC